MEPVSHCALFCLNDTKYLPCFLAADAVTVLLPVEELLAIYSSPPVQHTVNKAKKYKSCLCIRATQIKDFKVFVKMAQDEDEVYSPYISNILLSNKFKILFLSVRDMYQFLLIDAKIDDSKIFMAIKDGYPQGHCVKGPDHVMHTIGLADGSETGSIQGTISDMDDDMNVTYQDEGERVSFLKSLGTPLREKLAQVDEIGEEFATELANASNKKRKVNDSDNIATTSKASARKLPKVSKTSTTPKAPKQAKVPNSTPAKASKPTPVKAPLIVPTLVSTITPTLVSDTSPVKNSISVPVIVPIPVTVLSPLPVAAISSSPVPTKSSVKAKAVKSVKSATVPTLAPVTVPVPDITPITVPVPPKVSAKSSGKAATKSTTKSATKVTAKSSVIAPVTKPTAASTSGPVLSFLEPTESPSAADINLISALNVSLGSLAALQEAERTIEVRIALMRGINEKLAQVKRLAEQNISLSSDLTASMTRAALTPPIPNYVYNNIDTNNNTKTYSGKRVNHKVSQSNDLSTDEGDITTTPTRKTALNRIVVEAAKEPATTTTITTETTNGKVTKGKKAKPHVKETSKTTNNTIETTNDGNLTEVIPPSIPPTHTSPVKSARSNSTIRTTPTAKIIASARSNPSAALLAALASTPAPPSATVQSSPPSMNNPMNEDFTRLERHSSAPSSSSMASQEIVTDLGSVRKTSVSKKKNLKSATAELDTVPKRRGRPPKTKESEIIVNVE